MIASDVVSSTDEHTLLISQVLFNDVNGGEFVSLYNLAHNPVDISNWTIADGEGELKVPPRTVIPPGHEISLAIDAESFLAQNGRIAELALRIGNLSSAPLLQTGTFRLNNDGDQLMLIDQYGIVVDAVVFGTPLYDIDLGDDWSGPPVCNPGRGRILVRETIGQGFGDTDCCRDWISLREYRPGQSDFPRIDAQTRITCARLPEHSNIILDRFARAIGTIVISTYEINSVHVFNTMLGLVRDGVARVLLVEGSPGGGLSDCSEYFLSALTAEGADVYTATARNPDGLPRRYGCLHAKYAVIDHTVCIIMSENLVKNVFDCPSGEGNRGWAVIVESERIASALESVFRHDTSESYGDILRWSSSNIDPQILSGDDLQDRQFPDRYCPPPETADCNVTLHLFPDCTGTRLPIQDLIESTTTSFYSELFWAEPLWDAPLCGEIRNPLIESIESVISRCDELVMCFDGSWVSEKRGANRILIDQIKTIAAHLGKQLCVGTPPEYAPFSLIHNKGMIIDHRSVWISSANWNRESMCVNREVGLLIQNRSLAEYYERGIILDLLGDSAGPCFVPELQTILEEGKVRLTLSNESDESGLRRVIFRDHTGAEHNWSIDIGIRCRDVILDIQAEDLWGNSVSTRMIVFPSEEILASPCPTQGNSDSVTLMLASAGTLSCLFSGRWVLDRMRSIGQRVSGWCRVE